ncbi:MAG: glycosyltransferase family 4 protein [Pseudomonadota bacterium]
MYEKWQAFTRLKRKLGLFPAVGYAVKRLLSFTNNRDQIELSKADIIDYYGFVVSKPFGMNAANTEGQATINWVIPDFGVGSGGHLNIFRLVHGLEKQGFSCHVVIDGPCQFSSAAAARKCIRTQFFPIEAEVSIGRESIPAAWATVATSWQTAYLVRDFQATQMKFYFVQDFESYFYANSSESVFAEQTYNFGFHGITAGQWLADTLSSKYGMHTYPYGFSYDRDLYEPKQKKESATRHLFFYARPVTPRRGFELGMLVLNEVMRKVPNLEVIFAGWDISGYEVNFPHVDAGIVPLKDLADLYSQCDLALVLSLTNVSLLPLELMASGCPVVSNSGANVEWLLNDSNTVLVKPNVKDLSEAIISLLEDNNRLQSLREAGLNFARSTSWDSEISRLVKYLGQLRHASST